MACFQPNIAVAYGSREDGYKLKFIRHSDIDRSLEDIRAVYGNSRVGKLMFLPCGHCVACAQDYARAWQGRIMCEYESRREKGEEKSVFLTLTYINEPSSPDVAVSLLRQFIKDVRNKYGNGIKFFGCTERGSNTRRLHHHLILFGVDFEDKEVCSKRGLFYCYRSKIADKLWSHGFVQIGSLDIKSAGYVSKYCDKKKISGIADGESVIMSRGLGKEYFLKHKKEIFESDYLYFEGNKFKMPRIFIRWALNDADFYLKVSAEDYQIRKELVAASFRYDKCYSVQREEEAVIMQKEMLEYKKASEEVLRDVY